MQVTLLKEHLARAEVLLARAMKQLDVASETNHPDYVRRTQALIFHGLAEARRLVMESMQSIAKDLPDIEKAINDLVYEQAHKKGQKQLDPIIEKLRKYVAAERLDPGEPL